jgi:Flp pilus assembly protein TadD
MKAPMMLLSLLCAGCVHGPQQVAALSPAELYARGLAQAQVGDYARAEQYLASAQRAGHDERATSQALIGVCVLASRLRSALRYAEPVLARHPDDLALRRLVASLHWALGESAAAERQLSRLLELAPDDASAHYLLALVLEGQPAARTHYARYLALAPEGPHTAQARAAVHRGVEAPGTMRPRAGRSPPRVPHP